MVRKKKDSKRKERNKLDFSKVQTFPLAQRPCKVKREDYASPVKRGKSFNMFLRSLPRQLQAQDLNEFIELWAHAVHQSRPVIALCGAHVLKVGLGPLLIQAMKEGWISTIAFNGAGAVHDFELSYQGATSEDVAKGLEDGTFGMVEETARYLNAAAVFAQKEELGFGKAIAEEIEKSDAKYPDESVIVQASRMKISATIHVAIGTDIVHQHSSVNGAAIGAATYRDFQILCEVVAGLQGGGLVLNFGSAVILPEVFLKALTVARNLSKEVTGFSTADLDMIPQYRPRVNIVERPTQGGGRGFQFSGHHELMIPLVFQALSERLG